MTVSRYIFVGLLILIGSTFANEKDDEAHLERLALSNDVDRSIDKGLAWLVAQQSLKDGSFVSPTKRRSSNVNTGLSAIALMAAGHFPKRSKYGDNLKLAIQYLLDQAKANRGYLGADGSRMYGHGICTLALCEAYGMMDDRKLNLAIKDALDPAIKLILYSQVKKEGQHKGGWRYDPRPSNADLSVSVWQMLCLRSAKNSKLEVPDQAIKDAINYVRGTYNKNGFSYERSNPSIAMRTAGVVSMLALGANESKSDLDKIKSSAEFLRAYKPDRSSYFYYTAYYLTTAANMMGGEFRDKFIPKMEKYLISLQKADGSFDTNGDNCSNQYATAFSIICLAVRYQYLPIYQE